jgi:hypothetical protein
MQENISPSLSFLSGGNGAALSHTRLIHRLTYVTDCTTPQYVAQFMKRVHCPQACTTSHRLPDLNWWEKMQLFKTVIDLGGWRRMQWRIIIPYMQQVGGRIQLQYEKDHKVYSSSYIVKIIKKWEIRGTSAHGRKKKLIQNFNWKPEWVILLGRPRGTLNITMDYK